MCAEDHDTTIRSESQTNDADILLCGGLLQSTEELLLLILIELLVPKVKLAGEEAKLNRVLLPT
jgi:hypothetical protein